MSESDKKSPLTAQAIENTRRYFLGMCDEPDGPDTVMINRVCDAAVTSLSASATNELTYRVALDRAAYALFKLKRFADMPKDAIDFCREQHAEACKTLDDLSPVSHVEQQPEDVLSQTFDCNFDGNWRDCDKGKCNVDQLCHRRTAALPSEGKQGERDWTEGGKGVGLAELEAARSSSAQQLDDTDRRLMAAVVTLRHSLERDVIPGDAILTLLSAEGLMDEIGRAREIAERQMNDAEQARIELAETKAELLAARELYAKESAARSARLPTDVFELLRDLRHAGDLGYHGGTKTHPDCHDCTLVNRLIAATDGRDQV